MSENKMGNRGSKSDFKYKSVKEQRVDGSYFGFITRLRCTLMGGESRYQVKIPSKQLNRGNKYYSSNSYFKSTYVRTPPLQLPMPVGNRPEGESGKCWILIL